MIEFQHIQLIFKFLGRKCKLLHAWRRVQSKAITLVLLSVSFSVLRMSLKRTTCIVSYTCPLNVRMGRDWLDRQGKMHKCSIGQPMHLHILIHNFIAYIYIYFLSIAI